MKTFRTEQERFWSGNFGDQYITRRPLDEVLLDRIPLWADINKKMEHIGSCLEFGANVGPNLHALKKLFPDLKMGAIEINEKACLELRKIRGLDVYNESILEFESQAIYDLTFTCGVLIHINPAELPVVYDKLYAYTRRYIVVTEYYNPTPVEILYRGNEGKLFKRDFAGDLLDRFHDLVLVSYGFCYHRDEKYPTGDDLTWFLLEKKNETIGKDQG